MKKQLLLTVSVVTILCSLLSTAQGDEERRAKVIVIGVDGMRPDALIVADTPNVDRLIANGTFDPRCLILGEHYRKNNTVSGAGWSSILTGVWADKHGVHDNSFKGRNYQAYPHFFERIKAANPEAKTVSVVASWSPIDRYIVSAADTRHFFARLGSKTDLNVPADKVGIDTRDGQWHHLVGMRRNNTLYLYLDGEEIASTPNRSGNFNLMGDKYHFGRDARNGSTKFNGQLRNIRLWNHALDQEEIRALAENGVMRGGSPILEVTDPLDRDNRRIEPPLSFLPQDDYTVAASFRSTDKGRNILMGNYGDTPKGHLNLELHTNNHIRLYVNPPVQGDRMKQEMKTDTAATDQAVKLLTENDPTATWIYLHQPDAAGHQFGFNSNQPEYMNAIENFDHHIGRITEAVRNRSTYEQEDWIFILVTDHGGYKTGHGGGHNIPEIFHGFLLVSGNSVYNRISPRQTYIVDVVPTILEHLGIEIDSDLDGRSLGLSAKN